MSEAELAELVNRCNELRAEIEENEDQITGDGDEFDDWHRVEIR